MKMVAADRGAVVVTGASTGIGEACALHLDMLGFRVFAGVRNQTAAERLRARSRDQLTPLLLDVRDQPQIEAAANVVAASVGNRGLAGLVNNAGIAAAGPLEFLPIEELRRQLEVNVVGQVAVTQAFLALLRAGRGRIVNMGSVSGRSSIPLLGPYQASKYALEALTDTLRMELRPWGIQVSIVEPGGIATPIWEKSVAESDEQRKGLPPQANELYGPSMDAVRQAALQMGKRGSPTDVVVQAVAHALTAERPKTRYIVGSGARTRVLLQLLPDRLRDRLILSQISRLSD